MSMALPPCEDCGGSLRRKPRLLVKGQGMRQKGWCRACVEKKDGEAVKTLVYGDLFSQPTTGVKVAG